MSFTFDKCCCCIDLRTGCLIIGYMNLSGDIMLIQMLISGLMEAAEQAKYDNAEAVDALVVILLGVLLFFRILLLAFTIVLLVGVYQHKRGYIKAYLICATIAMVIIITVIFASFIDTPTTDDFINLILIPLSIYFLLCIRSYYLQMDDPSKRPAISNTA